MEILSQMPWVGVSFRHKLTILSIYVKVHMQALRVHVAATVHVRRRSSSW